ncbi:MAG: hypothetical protein NTV52_35795 [Acidobacteria bacterium]|nr:hypothetical protein [Acidobacteriota bacterium]
MTLLDFFEDEALGLRLQFDHHALILTHDEWGVGRGRFSYKTLSALSVALRLFPQTENTQPMSLIPETLSTTTNLAEQGDLPASLDNLRAGLRRARAAAPSPDAWRADVDRHVRPHPILGVSHESPFVHRCFTKPRGYAGDAVMLDFIYRHPVNRSLAEHTTPRGRMLMQAGLTTPAPRAVRNRCRLLADELDALCVRKPNAEILSLACGHLREAEHSSALAEQRFGRFVALDQDPESIASVQRDYGALGIEAQPGSVKTLLARGLRDFGQFDFIYAAGLYD